MLNQKLVETEQDIENLRFIRNQCARYMTRYNEQISRSQQKHWWRTLNHNKYRCFLYYENESTIPIGYGVVYEPGDNTSWLTGGLIGGKRGEGFGKIIFESLIKESNFQPWLDVREDNERGRKLYEKLGFKYSEFKEYIASNGDKFMAYIMEYSPNE